MSAFITYSLIVTALAVAYRLSNLAGKYPRTRSAVSAPVDVVCLMIELAVLAWVSTLFFTGGGR